MGLIADKHCVVAVQLKQVVVLARNFIDDISKSVVGRNENESLASRNETTRSVLCVMA